MSPALALVALSIAGQVPLPPRLELPGQREARLEADQVVYEPSEQVLIATGHAVLRTEKVLIRADQLTYDQASDRATAKGNVLFISGMSAALAEEVAVDMGSLEATVQGGLFMQKRNISRERLLLAQKPEELKAAGETVMAVSGRRIKKVGADEYEVDGLSFTPCDCNPTKPSWHIDASSANVKLGDRAILNWPVIYVHSVPVLALPWLYLPMSDRRTGLLVPRPNSTSQNGFSIDQPVFITLGPSYDLTLTPGYYFGGRPVAYQGPSPDGNTPGPVWAVDQQAFGVKGPRLQTEFRYAPSERTLGRATLGLLYDTLKVRDPVNPIAYDVNTGTKLVGDARRGLRGEGSWQQVQDLGGGWSDRIDAAVVSDGYYVKDLTADVLLRENQYLRSTGVLYHRDNDSYAGAEVALRQDLRWGYSLWGSDYSYSQPGSPLTRGPNTFHKLPALHYALPERNLWGPISGSASVDYTRLSPLAQLFGDEGTDGLFNPLAPDPDGTQANGRFDPGEREARDRLDLRPRLSASLGAGRFARLEPYLTYREDLYYTEITHQVFHRGYPMAGIRLDTEISRTLGSKGLLRHSVSPEIELRYVPRIFGSAPANPYDEVDSAIGGRILQGVVQLDQRLLFRDGPSVKELVRLNVGQNLDLLGQSLGDRSTNLGDTFARLVLTFGQYSFDALGRYNFPEARPTQVSASFNFDNGRGSGAYARLDHLVTDGPDRLRAGIDELFGRPSGLANCPPPDLTQVNPPPILQNCRQDAETVVVGGRYRFNFGLGLTYEAIIQRLKDLQPGEPRYNKIAQQVVGISYGPACDCWRVEAHAIFRNLSPPNYAFGAPDFGFNLTIARFGTLGNGR